MKASLLHLSAVLLAGTATAQNLVLNSSFEVLTPPEEERGTPLNFRPSGGLTPSAFVDWFETGQSTGIGDAFKYLIPPRTGDFCAIFGQVGTIGSIFQEIVTVPGEQYLVSFYLALQGGSEGGTGQSFSASWDGSSIYARDDTGFGGLIGYQLFSFNVTASGALTRLEFFGRNDPAWYYLDDVSVVAVTAVPEPGTWVAAALTLGAVGCAFRRRRNGAISV